jgi:hypothetical protein
MSFTFDDGCWRKIKLKYGLSLPFYEFYGRFYDIRKL